MKLFKRKLAVLFAACIALLCCFPTTAFAYSSESETVTSETEATSPEEPAIDRSTATEEGNPFTTDGNGQLQVSAEGIAAFVQELAAKYDTAGTSRTFHTVSGRDVALTGPYGWKIDQAGEAAALSQLIASTTESQIKEPPL